MIDRSVARPMSESESRAGERKAYVYSSYSESEDHSRVAKPQVSLARCCDIIHHNRHHAEVKERKSILHV